MSGFDVARTATAWAKGWSLTRGKASPVSQPYGCKIALGQPDHCERHVVTGDDEDVLRELAGTMHIPGTWLKVCAQPEKVAPLLHQGWQLQAPEYLMAAPLKIATAAPPEGYCLTVSTNGAVTEVELKDQYGQPAAKGRAAHHDGFATFDQIVTEPAHQRKGLGRVVMAALSNYSIAQGAEVGVLVATEQGRALYQAIGWTLVSPMTAAVVV
ncbi:GNAT family N-acetyltransferase [Pseudoduganella sp. OTU4001]|uniref:GNAT family N-acetyltransferase n=1 Tax=Pseudoduganella sp. OTU4001 TaxID=3043854 RepID=UPI00313EFE80